MYYKFVMNPRICVSDIRIFPCMWKNDVHYIKNLVFDVSISRILLTCQLYATSKFKALSCVYLSVYSDFC